MYGVTPPPLERPDTTPVTPGQPAPGAWETLVRLWNMLKAVIDDVDKLDGKVDQGLGDLNDKVDQGLGGLDDKIGSLQDAMNQLKKDTQKSLDDLRAYVDAALAALQFTVMGPPDWNAAQGRSVGTTYTADANGYIYFGSGSSSGGNTIVTINGRGYYLSNSGGWNDTNHYNAASLPLAKGDTYSFSPNSDRCFLYWIPARRAH